MKRARDLTVSDLFGGLAEYRGIAAALAALVGILVVLPSGREADVVQAGSDAASEMVAGADTSEPAAGEREAEQGPSTGATLPESTSASAASARAAGSPAVSGPGAATTSGASFPGVGSPAALGAADCDRATGYLRIQTKAWALPCVTPWPAGANNGGATAQGVTAGSIKVVAYYTPSDPATQSASRAIGVADDQPSMERTMEGWAKLWNRHAELYGRKIELVHVIGKGTSEEAQRADAIEVLNKHRPFAVMTPQNCMEFTNQMALRKVVSICSGPETLRRITANHPYLWQTGTGSTVLYEEHLSLSAEFLCKRIKGRPAKWAGDPLMRTQQRKFGWLYLQTPEVESAKRLFTDRLGGCGVQAVAVGLSTDQAQATEQLRGAIAKFKGEGANVVILDSGFVNAGLATKEATNQSYRPEWFATGYNFTDATIFIRAVYDLTQAAALYAFRETVLEPPQDRRDGVALYRWENGENPPAKLFGDKTMLPVWHAFANGVSLAGPQLTAETFRDGLFRMAPIGGSYQGAVTSAGRSFGRRGVWPWEGSVADTTAVDDTVFTWWSNSATGQDEAGNQGPGMMMFTEGGRRFRAGSIPDGEPDFFNAAAAVAEIADLPPGERPSAYPNKQGCPSRSACYPAG